VLCTGFGSSAISGVRIFPNHYPHASLDTPRIELRRDTVTLADVPSCHSFSYVILTWDRRIILSGVSENSGICSSRYTRKPIHSSREKPGTIHLFRGYSSRVRVERNRCKIIRSYRSLIIAPRIRKARPSAGDRRLPFTDLWWSNPPDHGRVGNKPSHSTRDREWRVPLFQSSGYWNVLLQTHIDHTDDNSERLSDVRYHVNSRFGVLKWSGGFNQISAKLLAGK
jgi:hypothetical protein